MKRLSHLAAYILALIISTGVYESAQARTNAAANSDIQGTWIFSFGDYYFDDSTNEVIEYELTASFSNGLLFFEEAGESILPMAATYDEATCELTFPTGRLGDFYGYGNLVQLPSFLNPSTGEFSVSQVVARYDAAKGIIEFPENSAMQWWIFDYNDSPMFAIDIYTFEGAVRKPGKKANLIVINKGMLSENQIDLSEVSRIDFRDGNAVFDNDANLTVPLSELFTVHFDEKQGTLSVGQTLAKGDVTFTYSRGALTVSGLPEGSTLSLYAISGARVMEIRNYGGEPVDLGALQPGIYIANSGHHTFKLIK